jgi:PAS domain S-box-containing protein
MTNKKIVYLAIYLSISILVVTYILSIFSNNLNFSFESISLLHRLNSIYYLLDLLLIIIFPAFILFAHISFSKVDDAKQKNLEKFKNQLEQNISLTKELLNDNLNSQVLSSDNDLLGNQLMQLRDKLKKNIEEERSRKIEDDRRSWATGGQAKFAELLRNNSNDLTVLSYNVISNLVKYLDSNQGGFFLLNYEEGQDYKETEFYLAACYAYEKQRIREKTIPWGSGLVGRCAIEKDIIFMTDIPENYIHITSGLGEETPRSLILVPLINNEEVLGVIEIASFRVFENYQIDFLKKIAEVVASTIAGVKINLKTAKLLTESQKQGDKLKKQEEEMLQNMEEMRMLQKEAAKQSEEFVSFSNSVNHTMIRADYDVDGTLIYANTKFLSKLGYKANSEVEGQNILKFINEKDHKWFDGIWENLSKGGKHYEGFMKLITSSNDDVWTLSTYTCVRNENGQVNKILFLAIDTTENKKQSLKFEGIISALNRSSLRAEFDLEGNIIDCNANYKSILEYEDSELNNISIFEIIDSVEKEKFEQVWSQIKIIPYDGTIKYVTKEKKNKWFFGTFSPVKDMYGEVDKIIFVGSDNTQHELISQKSEEQNKVLVEQEAKLHANQEVLEKRLQEAKLEMTAQFKEIEKMKILNEKTLEGALDGILTFNQAGEIIFFNKASEELWGFSKQYIIGKNVINLFSVSAIESDSFVNAMVDKSKEKIVGIRQEVTILDSNKEEKSVLMLLSEASVENEHTYTAFIQNIEIELF